MTMIVRVPAIRPLSPAQLAVVALVAEGWSYRESARMMGCSTTTVMRHINDAAARLPGDQPARFKVVAWWRGATADVLGVDRGRGTRQDGLKLAYTLYAGRACPHCGNVLSHGQGQRTAGGDVRSP